MITPDREFWFANKNEIESVTSAAAGCPVEIYWGATVVTGVGKRDSYQIMPVEDAHGGAFWEWHLDNNEQWFETPLKAASAFVQAYHRFQLQWSMMPS